jgi:DNA invertase Pin-like site-specific DNA recombinase
MNQLEQLREFAKRQGWEITREYVDHESGSRADRAEFKAMFQDASQGKFDVLLFWSLDRLSREGALATLKYLERLAAYRVSFRSLTEPYLDSLGVFGEGIIGLLACLAKQERLRISERTKAGLSRARAKGVKLGKRAKVVDGNRIMELRGEGETIRGIAAKLGMKPGLVHKTVVRLIKLENQKPALMAA